MANNTTYIPKFAYPFSQKDKNVYKEKLGVSKEGNYLFTQHGFWHGGIHFEGDMLTDLKTNEGIKCIADGELVAYRLNENYFDDGRGVHSSGFFLVRHKIEYPTNNKLTFFSLYMHTAKKDEYNIIQNNTNQTNQSNYYTIKKGDTLGKIAREHHTTVDKLRQDNNIVDVNKIKEGNVLIIKTSQSSQNTQSNPSNPNFIVENPEFDKVIILPTPKPISAGETIGLMGEYNVEGEKDIKCLHLEVFANEEFKTFVQTAQTQDKNLPQSFSWAKILDSESSTDHVSIFRNIRALYDESEDLKLSGMYMSLFSMIDKDIQGQPGNGSLEVQELEDAAKDASIKNITNNYIVKHSSEWDKTENMAQKLIEIVESISADKLTNKDEVLKDLELEKKRITNLSFFKECKGKSEAFPEKDKIEGFPKNDMVYVINAIGLVNEFSKKCLITKEMLVAMGCTTASNNQPLIDNLNKYCQEYEINTCLRVAHFLAQAAHESGGFITQTEDDTYRESVALQNGCYLAYRSSEIGRNVQLTARKNRDGTTQKDAQGNIIYNCKQPEYFNCKYANKNGNGNFASGDGHKFRGRGIIQLTGRDNYRSYNTFHNAKNPNDTQDFVNNPDLVKTNIEYTVESACWYWTEHGVVNSNINDVADRGSDDSVVLTVSKEVNGYGQAIPNGYNEPNKPLSRLPLFHKLKNHMGL